MVDTSGRPRDESIDRRVLQTCREVILEDGWESLSIRQIAARAGVSRSSVLRRWSSKANLVAHAALGQLRDIEPIRGSDRRSWIAHVVKTSHQTFKQPEMRAALPALIVAVQEDPDLKATMWHEFAEPAVKLFAQDPTSSAQESRLDAVAVLLMAAGAGWLTATAIDDDAADALCRRIEELLTVAVAGQE